MPLEFGFLSCSSQTLSGNININVNTMQLIYYLSGMTQRCKGKVPFKNYSENEEIICLVFSYPHVGWMDTKETNDCSYFITFEYFILCE